MPASIESNREGLVGAQGSGAAPPAPAVLCRADGLPVALLLAILIAIFWKVLFTSDMFFYRDVFNYSYPRAQFIRQVCRSGHLPYWNPNFSFGEPGLANPNYLFFYPSTLLLILLPLNLAYSLHYVLHWAMAAAGTYALARRWEQSRTAAFFAACVFTFSGPVLSLGNFYNHAACAAWMAWALLATDYAVRSDSRRPWVLLTVVFALQFLAAEPLTLFATFGLCFAYALACAGSLRQPLSRTNRRIVLAFVVVGLAMLALCAVQLLPSADLLHRSRRGTEGLPFNEITYWSLHPLLLLETVLPNFFGSIFETPTLWTFVLSCRNNPYFVSFFVGFVPLFFALIGWRAGRNSRRKFVALGALALLLLSFGRFMPIVALVYRVVPTLRFVRFPAKLLIPAILLVAILAGWGVDVLRQDGTHLRRASIVWPLGTLLAVVSVLWVASFVAPAGIAAPAAWLLRRTNDMYIRAPAQRLDSRQVAEATAYLLSMCRAQLPGLAGFALGAMGWLLAVERGRPWARRGLPAVVLLGIGELLLVNYSANPTVPPNFYSYRPPAVAQPFEPSQPYRYCALVHDPGPGPSEPRTQQFLNFDSIPQTKGFSTTAQVAFRDRLTLERGAQLTGVEVVENLDMEGALPPSYYQFWIYEVERAPDLERADCLLGRANVKYLVRRARRPSAATREVAAIFNGSAQPSYLYEDLCWMPRAYVASSALYLASPLETLPHLSDRNFDAQDCVFLNAGGSAATAWDCERSQAAAHSGTAPTSEAAGRRSAPAGQVEIVDRQPNTVVLRAELNRPGYVVLLDRFDPNWHATVDGHEVPILEANVMFRAVPAGTGDHLIRFGYQQRGLEAGAMVSALTLVILLALYFLTPGSFRQ